MVTDLDISGFVKSVREKLALTQEQLAEKLGCTKGNVSAWERGHHQPSYSQLCDLSSMSGLPLPHEQKSNNKIRDTLDSLGIDPETLSMEQAELVKAVMQVPDSRRGDAKKIINVFSNTDDKPDGKKEETK
ncbi:Transcriptional regulator, contains XRE-family HTH domain [Nitrosomonas marina]|uniref:Transcriptional regulator, contains XRE-family HTH domain n=2 Tax=Nitrosomonas marina TaxID=917 RepID=A0A1I0E8N5_9PROT|nr:Transcriptional regulator, contains XRE-family HTH domain [Nitrosomonas marina]